MKKLLIAALTLFTLNVCKAESPQINLRLPTNYSNSSDMAVIGAAAAITGAILCTAILLEGSRSYNSAYYRLPDGTLGRDEPPFLLQTPRQIGFAAGAVISISGIVTFVRNIK